MWLKKAWSETNTAKQQLRTTVAALSIQQNGGELGIRTPDTLVAYTRLAGEHLQPLGQLSVQSDNAVSYREHFKLARSARYISRSTQD